jgi:hypothetical protein
MILKFKMQELRQIMIIMANNRLFKMWGKVPNKISSIWIIPRWGTSMINKAIVSKKLFYKFININ